jgi:hypothetical protein
VPQPEPAEPSAAGELLRRTFDTICERLTAAEQAAEAERAAERKRRKEERRAATVSNPERSAHGTSTCASRSRSASGFQRTADS